MYQEQHLKLFLLFFFFHVLFLLENTENYRDNTTCKVIVILTWEEKFSLAT